MAEIIKKVIEIKVNSEVDASLKELEELKSILKGLKGDIKLTVDDSDLNLKMGVIQKQIKAIGTQLNGVKIDLASPEQLDKIRQIRQELEGIPKTISTAFDADNIKLKLRDVMDELKPLTEAINNNKPLEVKTNLPTSGSFDMAPVMQAFSNGGVFAKSLEKTAGAMKNVTQASTVMGAAINKAGDATISLYDDNDALITKLSKTNDAFKDYNKESKGLLSTFAQIKDAFAEQRGADDPLVKTFDTVKALIQSMQDTRLDLTVDEDTLDQYKALDEALRAILVAMDKISGQAQDLPYSDDLYNALSNLEQYKAQLLSLKQATKGISVELGQAVFQPRAIAEATQSMHTYLTETEKMAAKENEFIILRHQANEILKGDVIPTYKEYTAAVRNLTAMGISELLQGEARVAKQDLQTASQLKLNLQYVNSLANGYSQLGLAIQTTASTMSGLVSGFQAFAGVQALFNGSNDKVQDLIKNLLALQSIVNGLTGIGKLSKSFKELTIAVTKWGQGTIGAAIKAKKEEIALRRLRAAQVDAAKADYEKARSAHIKAVADENATRATINAAVAAKEEAAAEYKRALATQVAAKATTGLRVHLIKLWDSTKAFLATNWVGLILAAVAALAALLKSMHDARIEAERSAIAFKQLATDYSRLNMKPTTIALNTLAKEWKSLNEEQRNFNLDRFVSALSSYGIKVQTVAGVTNALSDANAGLREEMLTLQDTLDKTNEGWTKVVEAQEEYTKAREAYEALRSKGRLMDGSEQEKKNLDESIEKLKAAVNYLVNIGALTKKEYNKISSAFLDRDAKKVESLLAQYEKRAAEVRRQLSETINDKPTGGSKNVPDYSKIISDWENEWRSAEQKELADLDKRYEEYKKNAEAIGATEEELTIYYETRKQEIRDKYAAEREKKRQEELRKAIADYDEEIRLYEITNSKPKKNAPERAMLEKPWTTHRQYDVASGMPADRKKWLEETIKYNNEELADYQRVVNGEMEMLNKKLQMEGLTAMEIAEIHQKLADMQMDLDNAVAENYLKNNEAMKQATQEQMDHWNAAIGVTEKYFSAASSIASSIADDETKSSATRKKAVEAAAAFQVFQAISSTMVAANEVMAAYAEIPPLAAVLMAGTIATGMANVHTIIKEAKSRKLQIDGSTSVQPNIAPVVRDVETMKTRNLTSAVQESQLNASVTISQSSLEESSKQVQIRQQSSRW